MARKPKKANQSEYPLDLLLEKSIVEADYALLRQLQKSPEELTAGLTAIETFVASNGASGELLELCSGGCHRQDLLWLLHWFPPKAIFTVNSGWLDRPGVYTTEKLFGIGPKDVNRLVLKLNRVASEVEDVNHNFHFGIMLSHAESLSSLWELPTALRVYGDLLKHAAKHFASGSHVYHNIAKARLTTYVFSRTKDYHDREIAALISSILNDENASYDAGAHSTWRGKHYERLKLVDPLLVGRGPMTPCPIPPPPA